MRRGAAVLALTLAILFLAPSALAEKVFPDCLRFTQETETQQLGNNRVLMRTYPATCRPEVDAEIAKFAPQTGKTPDELKATFTDSDREYFRADAIRDKAIDFLVQNAVAEE